MSSNKAEYQKSVIGNNLSVIITEQVFVINAQAVMLIFDEGAVVARQKRALGAHVTDKV